LAYFIFLSRFLLIIVFSPSTFVCLFVVMPWYSKQPFNNVSVNFYEIATLELLKYASSQKIIFSVTFKQLFGLTPSTVQIIHFLYLLPTPLFQPKYLLWSLYFIKHYPLNSSAHLPFVETNEKTF